MIPLSWTHPTLQPSSRSFSGLLSPYRQGIYLGLKLCLSGKIKKLLYLNRIYCSESHLHLHSMAPRPLFCITDAAASITWLVTDPQVDEYQIFGFCSCFVPSVAAVALAFKPVGVATLAPCFFSSPCPKHGTSLVLTYHCGRSLFFISEDRGRIQNRVQNEVQMYTLEYKTKQGKGEENTLVIANTLFQQHKRRLYTWTSLVNQMVNTEIRLTIFFATKDGEALYSQQKQDQELTVALIMNSLLPNSDLNWRK